MDQKRIVRLTRHLATLVGVLCLVMARAASAGSASEPGVVNGRIEILNPKVKLRDGRADAGGVVVWLIPLPGAHGAEILPARRTLEQVGKRFVPHVMAVQVGAEVDFPNRDPFFHNVFSVYNGKTFDLGLYANGESRPVRFTRVGVSHIFCNIHSQMSAIIVTVDTPYFAVSGPDGAISIKGLPQGDYELHVWHERSDAKQLAELTALVKVTSAGGDLGTIRVNEAGYIPSIHKDKYGEELSPESGQPTYRRP
jgi:hypothetical protein